MNTKIPCRGIFPKGYVIRPVRKLIIGTYLEYGHNWNKFQHMSKDPWASVQKPWILFQKTSYCSVSTLTTKSTHPKMCKQQPKNWRFKSAGIWRCVDCDATPTFQKSKLPPLSRLDKTKKTGDDGRLLTTHQSTRRHIPEDFNFRQLRCHNFKSHNLILVNTPMWPVRHYRSACREKSSELRRGIRVYIC
jgi:hypothetical protein